MSEGGYKTQSGRWARTHPLLLGPAAAVVATGNSGGVELGDKGAARLALVVAVATGVTKTLDVTLETSSDNSTWRQLLAFTQKTAAAAVENKGVGGLDRFIRAVWTIAGTERSAVTPSGAGPAVGVSGTPTQAYSVVVKIILGGTRGTATFQVSLDGGSTFGSTQTTAASFVVPTTGLTLTFATGLYVADDTYSFTAAPLSFTFTLQGEAL